MGGNAGVSTKNIRTSICRPYLYRGGGGVICYMCLCSLAQTYVIEYYIPLLLSHIFSVSRILLSLFALYQFCTQE